MIEHLQHGMQNIKAKHVRAVLTESLGQCVSEHGAPGEILQLMPGEVVDIAVGAATNSARPNTQTKGNVKLACFEVTFFMVEYLHGHAFTGAVCEDHIQEFAITR